jgi:hypothetical protein
MVKLIGRSCQKNGRSHVSLVNWLAGPDQRENRARAWLFIHPGFMSNKPASRERLAFLFQVQIEDKFGSPSTLIPLANLVGKEHTERKKSEKEETNGEGLPGEKHRCLSKHKRSILSHEKPSE